MYEKLEELCRVNNTTVYRICRETGLHSSMFSNWKNGKYKPKADKLQKICDFFNVPYSYFDEQEPEQKASQYARQNGFNGKTK